MVLELEKKAYVCPSCRILFSVRHGNESIVVECPGCEESVRAGGDSSTLQKYASAQVASGESKRAQVWDKELAVEQNQWEASFFPWAVIGPAVLSGLAGFVILIMVLQNQSSNQFSDGLNLKGGMASFESGLDATEVLPSNEVMTAFLEKLFKAKSLDEVSPLVREDDVEYLSLHPESLELMSSYKEYIHTEYTDLSGYFVVRYFDQGGNSRALVVKQLADKSIVMDWQASYGIGEVTFDTFRAEKAKIPVLMRAMVTKTEYYNNGYDSTHWQSYSLSFEGSDEYLIAYASRRGFLVHQLEPFGVKIVDRPYTLYLKYPAIELSDARLVEIDSVASNGWILK